MKGISKNYGLAGGELDSRRHIEAAAERTCFPDELATVRELVAQATLSPVKVAAAAQN